MSSPGKPKCSGKNRINELPDDILLGIVSSLPMKEVGRTSVLSKRWKHVWAFIGTLNFDSREIFGDMQVEEPKYLSWVNHVIRSHKAQIIDEFKVHFDFTRVDSLESIDNWLRFALEKRVKRLKMEFSMCFVSNDGHPYTFPQCLSCKSLTSLELGCVNVTGEILESFLCNCLALEYLSVKFSRSLVELTVAGPALKLKNLIISRCFAIKKLEISAPNLVSVCYIGEKIEVQFRSTPKLAQVSFGGSHAINWNHCFSVLSSYLSQIEVLTLCSGPLAEDLILPTEDLVFPNVVKLNVLVGVYADDDLSFLGSLMKACPSMLDLRLEFNVEGRRYFGREDSGLRKPTPFLHHHLKTAEVVGFRGKPKDMEIILLLIETAVALEKLTIDTIKRVDIRSLPCPWKIRRRLAAEEIRPHLKPGTKLEIL